MLLAHWRPTSRKGPQVASAGLVSLLLLSLSACNSLGSAGGNLQDSEQQEDKRERPDAKTNEEPAPDEKKKEKDDEEEKKGESTKSEPEESDESSKEGSTGGEESDEESSTSGEKSGETSGEASTSESSKEDNSTSDTQTSEPGDATSSSDSTSSSSDSTQEEGAPENELQLFLSVDWEGVELAPSEISKMERFRKRYPEIPITHYLNAAYYTKPGARPSQLTQQIRRTLLDIDELGLHIHGWKALFEASGVRYRNRPVFFGKVMVDKVGDEGHNIDIGAYTTAELRKVIAFSIDTLEKQGFGRAKSFRSGGWMSRPSVIEALTAEGIERDASDVATRHFIDDSWYNTPLYRWLSRELWPNTHFASQPYYMKTKNGPLLQIPDNGALADYVTGEEMLEVYKACLAFKKKHPKEHVTMSFGFHTETAVRYLDRVSRGIELITAQAKRDGMVVRARTSAQLKVSAKP